MQDRQNIIYLWDCKLRNIPYKTSYLVKMQPGDKRVSVAMSEISIVLVEDHDLTRMGLKAALQAHEGLKVIGEAANATQGLKMLETARPDVAVVDIGLPDIDGIELTRRFKQFQADTGNSSTKILVLTMNHTEDAVLAAFAAGADSYYMKDTSIEQLAEAIQATYSGNSWIDPAIANVVLQKMRQGFPEKHTSDKPKTVKIEAISSEYEQVLETYPLTQRELEILELIVAGCSNGQIAEKLYITVGTVKTHVRNILNKLCADDRTQAAVRALRSGLVA
jgi:two-component system, NarL family, response regulator LiaR